MQFIHSAITLVLHTPTHTHTHTLIPPVLIAGFPMRPLRKLMLGFIAVFISFVLASILQLFIERHVCNFYHFIHLSIYHLSKHLSLTHSLTYSPSLCLSFSLSLSFSLPAEDEDASEEPLFVVFFSDLIDCCGAVRTSTYVMVI